MWIQKQTPQFLRLPKYVAPSSPSLARYWHLPTASMHVGPELQALFRIHLNLPRSIIADCRSHYCVETSGANDPEVWVSCCHILCWLSSLPCVSAFLIQRPTKLSSPSGTQHHSKQCFDHALRHHEFRLADWGRAGDKVREAAFAVGECPSRRKDFFEGEKASCLSRLP